ncbi:hypothetical protein ACVWZ3_001534 [Bradyrhizobium sp. i1.3.6]
MQAELVARLLRGLRRDHHAGAVGELGDQRRVRGLEHQLDGQGIDHLDMVDAGKLRLPERGRQRHVTLDRELCGFGVQRFAVMEFDVRPELDRHLLAVGRSLVGQRELRHDVELLVDVEQLVAEGGEDDAADIGAADAGIEDIGVFGDADAKRGLSLGCARERTSAQPTPGLSNA